MQNEEQKIIRRNLWFYPLGTVGRDMVYSLITNYLLTFVLFTHELTTGQLAAISAIMIAARVFDALNDPIMGNIIEHTRGKYGKFKPWLLIGVLTTGVVIYLMFNNDLAGWSFVWFFGIMYFMFSITYTMNDISYWGMVPALSSDADVRNMFTSRATLFAGIGGTLASILIPMLTTGDLALGGNAKSAYGIIALVIALLAPAFLMFTILGVKERRSPAEEKPAPFSMKQIFTTIARNDQLVWIAVIFLIQQIGNDLIVGGIGSTYIYLTFGYNGGLYSLFTTVGMFVCAFLMVFYPAISRRIRRKPLLKQMAILGVAGYAIMFISGLIPGGGMPKFWVLTVGYMVSNFGMYCYYLVLMISLMNTVEYNELHFGSRDEGIITSLRPFVTKLGSALSVAVTSLCYMIFGVTGFTNQISSLEQQASRGLLDEAAKSSAIAEVLSGVQGGQSFGILLVMVLLPCAMMLVSYLLYCRKFKLDEDEYDRICKELEAKRG